MSEERIEAYLPAGGWSTSLDAEREEHLPEPDALPQVLPERPGCSETEMDDVVSGQDDDHAASDQVASAQVAEPRLQVPDVRKADHGVLRHVAGVSQSSIIQGNPEGTPAGASDAEHRSTYLALGTTTSTSRSSRSPAERQAVLVGAAASMVGLCKPANQMKDSGLSHNRLQ